MLYYGCELEYCSFKVIFHATLMCSDPILSVPGVGVVIFLLPRRPTVNSSNTQKLNWGDGVFQVGAFFLFLPPDLRFLRYNLSYFQSEEVK